MLKDFNKNYCNLLTKVMNFTKTYLDIGSLDRRDEGTELVKLNFPNNTCYRDNLFTEETLNKTIIPPAQKTCNTLKSPCYIGYNHGMDVFLVGFPISGKNVAVVKLNENSATSDVGYELSDMMTELIEKYPQLVDIKQLSQKFKIGEKGSEHGRDN